MQTTTTPNSSNDFLFLMDALQKDYSFITTTYEGQQQERLMENLNTELFSLLYLKRWMTMGELKLAGNLKKQRITTPPPVSKAAPPAGKATQQASEAAADSSAAAKDSYAALKNMLASQERITETATALCAALPLAGAKPALVIEASRNHAEAGGMLSEYEWRLTEAAKNISEAAKNISAAAADISEAAKHSGGGEKTQAGFTVSYTKRNPLEV
jgi:hypothetical protein